MARCGSSHALTTTTRLTLDHAVDRLSERLSVERAGVLAERHADAAAEMRPLAGAVVGRAPRAEQRSDAV